MGFSAVQDPQAVKQYTFDWSAWLSTGETISAATVTADTGLTAASVTHDGTTVTFTLSGGTIGTRYNVVCHVTTSAGEQDDRTMRVSVENL